MTVFQKCQLKTFYSWVLFSRQKWWGDSCLFASSIINAYIYCDSVGGKLSKGTIIHLCCSKCSRVLGTHRTSFTGNHGGCLIWLNFERLTFFYCNLSFIEQRLSFALNHFISDEIMMESQMHWNISSKNELYFHMHNLLTRFFLPFYDKEVYWNFSMKNGWWNDILWFISQKKLIQISFGFFPFDLFHPWKILKWKKKNIKFYVVQHA